MVFNPTVLINAFDSVKDSNLSNDKVILGKLFLKKILPAKDIRIRYLQIYGGHRLCALGVGSNHRPLEIEAGKLFQTGSAPLTK